MLHTLTPGSVSPVIVSTPSRCRLFSPAYLSLCFLSLCASSSCLFSQVNQRVFPVLRFAILLFLVLPVLTLACFWTLYLPALPTSLSATLYLLDYELVLAFYLSTTILLPTPLYEKTL